MLAGAVTLQGVSVFGLVPAYVASVPLHIHSMCHQVTLQVRPTLERTLAYGAVVQLHSNPMRALAVPFQLVPTREARNALVALVPFNIELMHAGLMSLQRVAPLEAFAAPVAFKLLLYKRLFGSGFLLHLFHLIQNGIRGLGQAPVT